ncbi:hypothetical protein DAH56_06480 [Sphingomonas koreensis]|uniref:hypothetical protein n=1 Tax=Sphingomonas koreensis TaxID=93064 RepID=UPI000F7F9AC3|nr:hypothetical protein [Sphingomonas koreensis]RSU61945.1 hypothetical protein DAH56_06480 [Sphingomonas koreensis]
MDDAGAAAGGTDLAPGRLGRGLGRRGAGRVGFGLLRRLRPTGRLTGIVNGLTDQPSKGKATTPQASQIGPAVKSSLAAEVIRQLRPHWRSPTGADVELLRTTVEIRLNRDGTLAAPPRVINQTGVNASNRAQADLHKERALNAARLAAPFNLPAEYYDAWKILRPNFDRNLSR